MARQTVKEGLLAKEVNMPIYEYVCGKCGHAFEHLARSLKETAPVCPSCGAPRPRKSWSSFSARVVNPAAKACDTCHTGASCPAAGRGCCPSARPF